MAATHCWGRLMDIGFCEKAGARSCIYSIYPEDNRNSFGFVPPSSLGCWRWNRGPCSTGELHSSFAMACKRVNILESVVCLKKQAEIGMEAEANSGACVS